MKRAPALEPLSRDHNQALLLARRAQRAARADDNEAVREAWRALQGAWRDTISDHFDAEEDLLFPHLRAHGEAELATQLLREHEAIRRTLTRSDRLDAVRLGVVGDLIEHHVRVEERQVFPLLERVLAPPQLTAIEAALASR